MSDGTRDRKTVENHSTPSLLEPESRGGDTAEGGFGFQDGVILSAIPRWLAHEGFASFIRESIGDIESRWFDPASGEIIDTIEAKNHRMTPSPFWKEIDRFQRIASSPQHRHFRLACTTVSDDIKAIHEAIRRIRDPLPFYGSDSVVVTNSVDDFVKLVEEKGKDRATAMSLLHHVDIDEGWTDSKSHARGIFQQEAEKWLPGFDNLPGHQVGRVFDRLLVLVRERLNKPVTRKELESTISGVLERSNFFAMHPIRVETTTAHYAGTETAIRFRWDEFFGDNGRTYPPPPEWQHRIVDQLASARRWIADNRSQRRIIVGGERRLSTSVAVGSQFPAVAGSNVELEYRGEIWATDSYPQAGDFYDIFETRNGAMGKALVVIVDILRDISEAVNAACAELGLRSLPVSHFHGARPVASARQANTIVCFIKQAIEQRLHETGAENIHLFLACPAPLAVFLGHRLNATAPIQCYEWTGGCSYVPTCHLRS